MTDQAQTVFSYDSSAFNALMAEYKSLRTFAEVQSWDQRAKTELEEAIKGIQILDSKSAELAQKLERLKKEHEEKGFFAKALSNRNDEKTIAKSLSTNSEIKPILEKIATILQEAIDFTPNSADEQKSLLVELKARKKELQVEKRETAATMKAIRKDARVQSAHAGVTESKIFGKVYHSGSAAIERRNIRYQKEAALQPHEDAKDAIERQLIQVDKDILWAEKFTA